MAYETGVASNTIDLMNKLTAFLTTHPDLVATNDNWINHTDNEVNVYQTDADMTTSGTVMSRFFESSDKYPDQKVHASMWINYNYRDDWYHFGVAGSLTYSEKSGVTGQYGSSSNKYALAWHDEMPYWFIANGHRFIVIFKVSTNYEGLYVGLITPSGTDREYPRGIFIGGSDRVGSRKWTTQEANGRSSFWRPVGANNDTYPTNATLLTPFSRWDHASNANSNFPSGNAWPNYRLYMQPMNANYYLNRTVDGSYILEDITIFNWSEGNYYGTLDGVYRVSGFQMSQGNIITVDGSQYLCVALAGLTDYNNWGAIKLE